MGPDDLPDDLLDDEQPRVKIHPPIFKGTPGERPDAHIYAAEDWMEAMRVRRDDFITKFKHTLNHLAREWYHSLDLDQFEGDWNRFTTHFSRISQLRVETLNISMKDGGLSLLTLLMMTSKNILEMSRKLLNS